MIHSISQLTPLYSELDKEYNQAMSGPYKDLSVKTPNGEVVAGLKNGKITGMWRPAVIVGTKKFQREQIKRLWSISPDIYLQDFKPVSEAAKFLLTKGVEPTPYYTQMIDLTKTEQELKHSMRKSYKSLINGPAASISMSWFRSFKESNRDEKTWEIQSAMAPMFFGAGSSAVMFYHNNDTAYYASAVGENTHPLIWKSMLQLKKIGVRILELGEQVFNEDIKANNISKFKRGFGGKTVMRLNFGKAT